MPKLLPVKSRIKRRAWTIEAQERRRQRVNLKKGLLAYWKLEEGSGTRVDATGRGNDLTAFNSPTNAAGKLGNAANFVAGSSQYLSRGDNADLKFDGDFTIACWLYLESKTADMAAVSKYGFGGDALDHFILTYDQSNDLFRVYIADGDGVGVPFLLLYANNFGSPPTGEWLFVCTWRKGVNVFISVNNGVADVIDTSGVNSMPAGTADFQISGVQDGATIYWDGRIDEVEKWNRALNSSEIAYVYNLGNGRAFLDF